MTRVEVKKGKSWCKQKWVQYNREGAAFYVFKGRENPPMEIGIQIVGFFSLLKPVGYVMHQQFNIQQLYALPTLYLCVLYLSENKQRLVPLTS